MNDICERLRSAVELRRAVRDAINPAMGLPHTDLMLDAADEIERLRLADEERDAIAAAMEHIRCGSELGEPDRETARTLKTLLERLK